MLMTFTGCQLSGCEGGPTAANKPVIRFDGSPAEQADRIYQEAWRTVLEEYVDPKFNAQDWYRWKDHYQGKLQDPDDAYVAVQTMLGSLDDQYTRFLKPRDMQEQTISIDSKLYGIGIQIAMKNSELIVISTFEDTPAAKAGLLPMDVITHINGKEASGMTVEKAADNIRGKEGTLVNLTIQRGKTTFTRDIPRAEIKIKSVFTKETGDKNIGYIRLNSFISETVVSEMMSAIAKLEDRKALILDLRGNYGGLLSNAVDVADMFLNEGAIVQIVDRDHHQRNYTAQPGELISQPLVILVDGGSASASEILSGALKDHHRATLIGTRTYGKGLVQKINPLSDGSGVNITISKYLTPRGTDINKKGIEPDIEVAYKHDDFFKGKDPQLDRAIAFLKKQYPAVASAKK